MRRPSLRPQLNQIRLWVRQGRTDPWIAHKLDITVEQLEQFKRDHKLEAESEPVPVSSGVLSFDSGLETELDDEPVRDGGEEDEEQDEEEEDEERDDEDQEDEDQEDEEVSVEGERVARRGETEEEGSSSRRRRRGRRGGRKRGRSAAASFEGTFEQGDEGYGLWLDPAVADAQAFNEHWAGHRDVTVTIEADAITIRRAGSDE